VQIFIIILVASLLVSEQLGPPVGDLAAAYAQGGFLPPTPLQSVGWTVGSFALLMLFTAFTAEMFNKRLRSNPNFRLLLWSHRAPDIATCLALGLHVVAIFAFGYLSALRALIGDTVLLDECAALLPAVCCLLVIWNGQYPLSRRLRMNEARHALDPERARAQVWSRGQFLLSNVRMHLVLLLLPMLLLLTWSESLTLLVRRTGVFADGPDGLPYTLTLLAGSLALIAILPWVICRFWGTRALESGPLRQRLEAMCLAHGVRIRDIHLWHTYHAILNGAVIGFIPRIRYVLLTDRLIDDLPPEQVEAVMAHELAHIRRRHLLWFAVVLSATLWGVSTLTDTLIGLLPTAQPEHAAPSLAAMLYVTFGVQAPARPSPVLEIIAITVSLAAALAVFGWVSRRFERQADTFAVQHLSGVTRTNTHAVVTEGAAHTMIAALQRIIELNHVPAGKRSWRHGSIAWRQRYLATLPGQRADQLAIDRTVVAIKITFALLLAGLSAWTFLGG